MKRTVFLFCLYLMALVLVPCSDSDSCGGLEPDHYFIGETEHSHHHSGPETCTPFCLCSCCGQSYNNEITGLSASSDFTYADTHPAPDKVSFLKDVYIPIWQPPKIA